MMEKIASDSPLTDEQAETLKTLVGLMIPASETYGVPGADDPQIFGEILVAARKHAGVVSEALTTFAQAAETDLAKPFTEVTTAEGQEIVNRVQALQPRWVAVLVSITVECYYRDARVMASLEMPPRAPFPEGYDVPQGDWSLLDPVRERGPIWRRTS